MDTSEKYKKPNPKTILPKEPPVTNTPPTNGGFFFPLLLPWKQKKPKLLLPLDSHQPHSPHLTNQPLAAHLFLLSAPQISPIFCSFSKLKPDQISFFLPSDQRRPLNLLSRTAIPSATGQQSTHRPPQQRRPPQQLATPHFSLSGSTNRPDHLALPPSLSPQQPTQDQLEHRNSHRPATLLQPATTQPFTETHPPIRPPETEKGGGRATGQIKNKKEKENDADLKKEQKQI